MHTAQPCDVLIIDRSIPFNPAKFIGEDWSIWKGPKEGNGLDGEEQQDARSLAFNELDLLKLLFKHCLKEGEESITREEKLARLKKDHASLIRPDARIVQALFEEFGCRTLLSMRENLGEMWSDFPGTELRSPNGRRYTLGVRLCNKGCFWYYRSSDSDCNAEDLSCVIANEPSNT